MNKINDVADNATVKQKLGDNLPLIMTLAMLQEKGFRIGRLAGNRTFDSKIIKAKKKSLKETGLLVPAIIVEAEDAIDEGLEVVDFETNETVSEDDAKSYVVLVDANHRYKAHLELLKTDNSYSGEFYFMFPLQEISVAKMLSEINIATNPWKTADFGRGAAMLLDEDLPLLSAINDLTAKGYSVDAASLWLTFEKKISKSVLVDAMNGKIVDKLRDTKNIENGQKLLNSARKSFNEDFLAKRYLADWILSKLKDNEEGKSSFIKKMCNFLSNIDRHEANKIEKSKGERGGDAKETLINKALNSLWEQSNSSVNK